MSYYTSTQNTNAKLIYQINLHVALRFHNLSILECEYPTLSIIRCGRINGLWFLNELNG